MSKIAYDVEDQQEETVAAFLMLVLEYATEIGLFVLLERMIQLKMKKVVYSAVQKAQTVMASLVMGCAHTKAINETLGAEQAAARYLGMERFPDQSQINRYLGRFTADNVDELGAVHARLLRQESRARRAVGQVVVDGDQCGVVANGKTYAFARKGYFPHKRGEAGYQVSVAYCGAYEEAIALYLDPGNTHCKTRLPALLRAIDHLFALDDAVEVILRLDAGYDSADHRRMLAARPGSFVLKGARDDLARALAQRVPVRHWVPVSDDVHGAEVDAEDGVRRLVYELHQADGTVRYALLYTTLPAAAFGVARLFTFYNERTTIETFFCQSRHVFNIQNLRSRKFDAIYAFLRFVLLTHNVLHWAKQARLAATPLVTATTRQLVDHVARVRAHVHWDGHWQVRLLRSSSPWATLLIDALTGPPRPVQLPLPFARLHKT